MLCFLPLYLIDPVPALRPPRQDSKQAFLDLPVFPGCHRISESGCHRSPLRPVPESSPASPDFLVRPLPGPFQARGQYPIFSIGITLLRAGTSGILSLSLYCRRVLSRPGVIIYLDQSGQGVSLSSPCPYRSSTPRRGSSAGGKGPLSRFPSYT